jgi:hypothetical protein
MAHFFYLLFLSLLFLNISFAQEGAPENQDPNSETYYEGKFGGGNEEFEIEKFDNESVLLLIKRDMDLSCDKKGLCTLSAVTSDDRRFTTQFIVGQGNNMAGVNTGNGTTVILPGTNGYTIGNEPYFGLSLRFTNGRCTQNIKVPRSLYISINRYMYGLMTEEGGTRRGFTPADEAMIMFYSTIMKQATGCVAGQ